MHSGINEQYKIYRNLSLLKLLADISQQNTFS